MGLNEAVDARNPALDSVVESNIIWFLDLQQPNSMNSLGMKQMDCSPKARVFLNLEENFFLNLRRTPHVAQHSLSSVITSVPARS